MSATTEQAAGTPLLPRCPHCQIQPCPVTLGTTSWEMGNMTAFAAIYCCARCAMILSIAPLQAPPGNLPEPVARIVVPGTMQ